MPPAKAAPSLDFSKLAFPSDKITFGRIRQENPEVFTNTRKLFDHSFDSLQIAFVVIREMALAERAYALAMGQPDPHPDKYDPEVDVSHLNAEYRTFGVSSGMHQTKQFVRDIEAAARQQAEQHMRGRK